MQGRAEVNAGVCGHRTTITAETGDGRAVTFVVETTCENITRLTELLEEAGAVDAYQAISPRAPANLVLDAGRAALCCPDCIVPAAALKAMRVAAQLALVADVHIALVKE